MMNPPELGQKSIYRIRLKGVLVRSIADWFGDITIIPQKNAETLLIGSFPDQSALRGLLDQIWNLNFTVLSVERIEKDVPESPENPHHTYTG